MSSNEIKGLGNHQLKKKFEEFTDNDSIQYNDPAYLTIINELDERRLLKRTIRQYFMN